ncbi:MAG: translocation/assembly module TamB domain-containing protein [Chitinophagaceae bacterium]
MSKRLKTRRIVRIVLRIFLGLLLLVVILVTVVLLLLRTDWGNRKLTGFASSYLSKKFGSKVAIQHIDITNLSSPRLIGLDLRDPQGNLVASFDTLQVGLSIEALLTKSIDLKQVSLSGLKLRVIRSAVTGKFNYQFMVDAFASGDTSAVDTSASSWRFALEDISLRRIDIQYIDQLSRDSFLVAFKSLNTSLKGSDFFQPKIATSQIRLDSLKAYIQIGESAKQESKTPSDDPVPLQLAIRALQAGYVDLKLRSVNESISMRSVAGLLDIQQIGYEGKQEQLTIHSIRLDDHTMDLKYKVSADTDTSTETSASAFVLKLDSLMINRNQLAIRQEPIPKVVPRSFDAGDLDLKDLNLSASNVFVNGGQYGGKINALRVVEGQGFEVRKFTGELFYADTAFRANNVQLLTAKNDIAFNLGVSYPSLDALTKQPAKTKLTLDVKPSVIKLDEFTYFVPDLRSQKELQGLLTDPIRINAKARGTLDDLQVSSFQLQHLRNKVSLSSRLLHVMQPEALIVQAEVGELTLQKNDLRKELGKMIPDSAWDYIPDDALIRGKLNGNADDITMDLKARTSLGSFTVAGNMKHPSDAIRSVYDLRLTTQDLALQKILKDTTLGPVTAQLSLKGAGYDLETMRASVKGNISKAEYNGYVYEGVSLDGNLNRGRLEANLQSADPHMDLDVNIAGLLGQRISDLMVDADVRKVDLMATGFMKEPFVVSGKLSVDADVIDSSQASGSLRLDDLTIATKQKTYFLDTMDVLAYQFADTQFVKMNTPFGHAILKGQFRFDALPGDVKTVMNAYTQPSDTVISFQNQTYVDFSADVKIPDSLISLIPNLKKLSPFSAKFQLNTSSQSIVAGVVIPQIMYGDYRIDTLIFGVAQDKSKEYLSRAVVALSMRNFVSPWIVTNRVSLAGIMDKGMFDCGIVMLKRDDKTVSYGIPFMFYNHPERPFVSFKDSLVLNTYGWNVNEGNKVFLNPSQLGGSNLKLYRGNQELDIFAANDNDKGFPLSVQLKGFYLESLSALLDADSALIKGEVNASAVFNSFSPLNFTSDLRIKGLAFQQSAFGDLTVDVHSVEQGNYVAKLGIQGAGNDVQINGNYQSESGSVQAKAQIGSFNIDPLSHFVKTFVDSLKGRLSGNIDVKGTTSQPEVNGALSLDSLKMILVTTGTPISIPKADLLLEGRQMRIRDLNILDSAGRPAVVRGEVRFNQFDSVQYDLKLETKRFLIAGHKRYPQQILYGPLSISSLLTLKGDMQGAKVNGNIDVLDSSSVTYVYRESEVASKAEGLIEFFDPSDSTKDAEVVVNKKPIPSKFALDVNSYVSITPKSALNIVLSEESGDKISVKGKSNLNFSMNPSGAMELVGSYEVESGTYDLSIAGLIRKEFLVDKGSTITWTGDVKKANVNLTAVYKVKTDAAELVQDIGSMPGITKQKFDFLVYMDISGDLLKPDIKFRLDMKEDQQAAFDGMVYTRIKQVNSVPSELNKQVMGLLALQTFIADNPFSSVGGGNLQTEAFSTAGNLLTRELNNFIGNSIKDVDIDIGLDIRDDYTSGNAVRRSDLKVGLAKSFNNNRLNVYVGSTFALENQNQQQDLLNGLAGDVSLEYLLTRDGRYRLKGYRINKHDLTFNGVVVETGATFVVVVEFNKLKNAFRRKKNL